MSTILGNPIVLGGGAKLNIDFSTTQPSDTSKLWVPLAQKPSVVDIDICVPYGDEFITNDGTALAEIGGRGAVCEGALYVFGASTDAIYYRAADGTFLETGDTFDVKLQYPSVISVGNSIYIVGPNIYNGYSYSDSTRIYKYVPSSHTITRLSDLPEATVQPALTRVGYKIYFFFGGGSNYYGYIDTTDDSVVPLGKDSTIGPGSNHFIGVAAGSFGKYAYILGGASGTLVHDKIARYDVETNTFKLLSITLPEEKYEMAYAQYGQYLYMFGGILTTKSSNQVWQTSILRFDCANEQIETLPETMVVGLTYPFATTDGNTILVSGTGKKEMPIYKFTVKSELAENKLMIQHDYYAGEHRWEAVNQKGVSLKIYPINAYIGNSQGLADETSAYLYDGTSGTWKSLDGVSMTADMLAALATLGVT